MVLVIDTHALLWFLSDDPKLGQNAKKLLTSRPPSVEIVIPIIVLFEIAYLQKRKALPLALEDIYPWIAGSTHVRVHPLDIVILDASPTELEMHDAMIVGTALALSRSGSADVRIITQDRAITSCDKIQTLW